jgi:hypothetical protein
MRQENCRTFIAPGCNGRSIAKAVPSAVVATQQNIRRKHLRKGENQAGTSLLGVDADAQFKAENPSIALAAASAGLNRHTMFS